MRHMLRGVVLLASLATVTSGFADTIEIFNLNGTLQSGGTANGTIAVDTTTGYVSAATITVSADNSAFNFTYLFMQNTQGGSPPTADNLFFLEIVQNTITNIDLNLLLPEPLVNFQGGSLCALTTPCPGVLYQSSFSPSPGVAPTDFFVTLLASQTPEPAPWLYVLTGLVALAGKLSRASVRKFGRN